MNEQIKKIFRQAVLYSSLFLALVLFSLTSKINPIVILFLFFILAYLKIVEFKKPQKTNILNLAFLFSLGFALIIFPHRYTTIPLYYIPVPAISMLTVILFSNLELAFLVSLCLSILLGVVAGNNLPLAIIMFLGCLTGAFSVSKIRQRYKIIRAGIFVSIAMVISLLAISYRNINEAVYFIIPALINGILSSFIVAGVLPVLEFLFNVVTNISLLELADFNHPLLKRLVLEAPGTYHHSLLVGNLAEVACESINANSLLARVGAYYHDIGKVEKPEYFLENQGKSSSRHGQLKASMSKLVIINHVKEGLALAHKHKLNSSIIDFIEQHHGRSLVFYFYIRALEEAKDNVKEDVFRYPGPKPQTKETAIVLLADSVEAACRSLGSPSAQRIDEVVHTVINNKFIDGQLDECDLTLKDLNKIAEIFIRILSAVYHSRIGYPEIKSEDNSKQPSDEVQNQSRPDKNNIL